MEIKKCTLDDTETLAQLNKQLIEDEKSDNPMTLEELEYRMERFITTEYDAYFFVEDANEEGAKCGEILGYALVKNSCTPLYLRQFFIKREHRKKHLGTEAFQLLKAHLKADTLDIEVLSWNEAGMKFWQSLGFCERSRYMRYQGEM